MNKTTTMTAAAIAVAVVVSTRRNEKRRCSAKQQEFCGICFSLGCVGGWVCVSVDLKRKTAFVCAFLVCERNSMDGIYAVIFIAKWRSYTHTYIARGCTCTKTILVGPRIFYVTTIAKMDKKCTMRGEPNNNNKSKNKIVYLLVLNTQ